ncbi:MAG: hypothetical protein GXY53_12080 [Desulfobulbus sp.]|nr:hypothetical protein [Desulfobulbus sp.]
MTFLNTFFLTDLYSGSPVEKVDIARRLYAVFFDQLPQIPQLSSTLITLQHHAMNLNVHMQSMGLGQLCSRCAAGPGGGCCSAYMADNCDVIQILLNLLMDVRVTFDTKSTVSCGFLGPSGCLFHIKPIFCLNYNCTHILRGAASQDLSVLYRFANTVLSGQTDAEAMLLSALPDLIKNGLISEDGLKSGT